MNNLSKRLIGVVAISLQLMFGWAKADPVQYVIRFSESTGPVGTGSFVYDDCLDVVICPSFAFSATFGPDQVFEITQLGGNALFLEAFFTGTLEPVPQGTNFESADGMSLLSFVTPNEYCMRDLAGAQGTCSEDPGVFATGAWSVTKAGTVLVRDSGFSNGYGGAASRNITAALDAATGNNVTVVSDLSDLNLLMSFDGLWIDLPETDDHPLGPKHLTSLELANIDTFIAAGRRVVMIGENHLWTEWDNQILGIVGGMRTTETRSVTATSIISHELTDSANTIMVFASGFSTGGTPLYESFPPNNFIATLWGDNVVTILDSFLVNDVDWALADNAQFAINVANWVATPLTIDVTIDIKPGDEQNKVNPNSTGTIWVAVLSASDTPFDPLQIDISTVRFGPNDAMAIRNKVADINQDGLADLLLRFKIRKTGIQCGDTEATLTGETYDGLAFTGTDSIKTVRCQ